MAEVNGSSDDDEGFGQSVDVTKDAPDKKNAAKTKSAMAVGLQGALPKTLTRVVPLPGEDTVRERESISSHAASLVHAHVRSTLAHGCGLYLAVAF